MKLTPKQVREMIENASKAELEGVWICAIMKQQTEDEKVAKTTKHSNGVGLSACDAGRITYYFNLVRRGQHLDEDQFVEAKQRLVKYSKQLAGITA